MFRNFDQITSTKPNAGSSIRRLVLSIASKNFCKAIILTGTNGLDNIKGILYLVTIKSVMKQGFVRFILLLFVIPVDHC